MKARLTAFALASWRDEILRRLLRNVGYLISGNAIAALIGLAALALTARALGPEALGILALIEAYVRLVDRLARPEPWQALIKYGAAAFEQDRGRDFRSLIKFGTLLDLGGALLASLVALGGVLLAQMWFGWNAATMEMAALYSLSLQLRLAATPIAVLRLFDRFAVFAWLEAGCSSLRLVLVVLAWAGSAGIWAFLMLNVIVQIARNFTLLVLAWRELSRRGFGDFLRAPLRGVTKRCPGIWNFIWTLNLAVLIRKSTREVDTLLVGSLLDPAAVGLYTVAKRLGDAALKIGVPIQQAIFPDVARLWARGQAARMRKTVLQVNLFSGALAGVVLLVVAAQAERLLALTVGRQFTAAAASLVLQMGAATLALGGIALRPALLSMGLQRQHLYSVVFATLAFYSCLLVGLPSLGLIGASLAHVVLNGVWLTYCLALLTSHLREPSPSLAQCATAEAGGDSQSGR